MDKNLIALLVVLAPSLAALLVCLFVHGRELVTAARRFMDVHFGEPAREMFAHAEHVETLKEVTLKAGAAGGVVGAIFGYSADSHEASLMAVGVALLALLAVFHLSRLSVELATAEDKERRRKMAGAVRDIVRSELRTALGTEAPQRRAKLKQDDRRPTMRRT